MQRFAESLGLPGAPKIKFLSKEIVKKKNESRTVAAAQLEALKEMEKEDGESESEEESDAELGDSKSGSEDSEDESTGEVESMEHRRGTSVTDGYGIVEPATIEPSKVRLHTIYPRPWLTLIIAVCWCSDKIRSNVRKEESEYPLRALFETY